VDDHPGGIEDPAQRPEPLGVQAAEERRLDVLWGRAGGAGQDGLTVTLQLVAHHRHDRLVALARHVARQGRHGQQPIGARQAPGFLRGVDERPAHGATRSTTGMRFVDPTGTHPLDSRANSSEKIVALLAPSG
jgi:hypothetical protein